ncbi:Metalloendopeptidase [Aphelenchoides besseyi]|nr:Metalloendopeptidase [Aphelenchoides besseyi]KAI6211776.1 Metalloendopeptidase [Aphelenchoides besseyi]
MVTIRLLLFLPLIGWARNVPFDDKGLPVDDQEEQQDDDEPEDHLSIYQINSRFRTDEIVYGDILLTAEQKQDIQKNGWGVHRAIAKKHGRNRWPSNIVPYELSNRFSSSEKAIIKNALSNLQSQTCFKFPKRNGHKDYVYVDKKDGCYSVVGRQGGRQLMSLGNGCIIQGTVQHEFLHALGIQHEHQRPDRDKYIRVLYKNLESGMKPQVEKIPASQVDLHGIKYDYKSIMHYDGHAFGRQKPDGRLLNTLVPLQKGVKLRDNQRLTSSDLKRLRILGNCNGGKIKKSKKKKKRGRGRRRG